MLKDACLICKIVGVLAILGMLNWGSVGLFGVNFVDSLFGEGTLLSRVIYAVFGLSGIAFLASFFVSCPACKKP